MPGYEVIGSEELAEVQDVFTQGGVLFRHGFDGLAALRCRQQLLEAGLAT